MSSLLTTVALFTVVLSAFVGYLYLFGLPSTTKRKINDAALNAMGENNKSTNMVKDALNRIPDSDSADKDVHDKNVREGGVSDITMAGVQKQNPLGEAVRLADATKKLAWQFSRPGRRLRLTGISQVGEKTDEVHRPVAGR
ncbi:uncharacterized protein K489DRAFT_383884 [Dissoconium aciculare CBS 342.82]|uniref:Uncharacterized protein n=1 Tax=Dissoconium aciculare CBS 342.82 TaxID=1314786 RepID=A0A6J3LVE1_9PEZI|nr:uncharacterized protein K489DRAFT_383884 [Dissoconium aciculare CBS 342.82]KAF1819638.1 hypothetical protein K489DRAFT_383884 [Dissoconium aciculare CBS 342.82]